MQALFTMIMNDQSHMFTLSQDLFPQSINFFEILLCSSSCLTYYIYWWGIYFEHFHQLVWKIVHAVPWHTFRVDGARLQPIHYASRHKRLDLIQEFLSRGISIDHPDEGNCTPLHHAAKWGCTGKLYVIISDKNIVDSSLFS